ncbi:hypothetical protein EB796_024361 [Bugula neritina]|uniref:EGF-like domain-containing protein n=1 Tax=Bugula neritina TaxID=10212 RepID=A0A7J7ITT0_BUGNE|nr:hypothetical protein EB796_024361 [Bugula neritina]
MVLCVANLTRKTTCPHSQLLSPFWYNRFVGDARGLDPVAKVYRPIRRSIGSIIFANLQPSELTRIEYNTTHPRGIITEDDLGKTPVYPFDAVKFQCSMHYFQIRRNDKTANSTTVICQANLTLPDDVRKQFCIPNDMCQLQPCLNKGTCENLQDNSDGAGFKCTCRVPHFGERCELTACSLSPKEVDGNLWIRPPKTSEVVASGDYCVHGNCSTDGKNSCTCIASAGPKCEYDVNECVEHGCQNGGVCIDQRFYHICLCRDGFFGPECGDTYNICDDEPCQNGGTCLLTQTGYKCYCQGKWLGKNCEQEPIGNQKSAVGISLAVATAVIFFFTSCCMCLTKLRERDRKYAKTDKVKQDIALLFEVAEKKYGVDNLVAQQLFVDFIYNQTDVIQQVDAVMNKDPEKDAARKGGA